MKKQYSFIDRFDIKFIFGISLIIVVPEIIKFIKSFSMTSHYISRYDNAWFDISVGLILALLVATKLKYIEEKIALIMFGLGIISNAFRNGIGYKVALSLVITFELIGTYFFWLAYKINRKRTLKTLTSWSRLELVRLFLILFTLFVPAILLWVIGKVSS